RSRTQDGAGVHAAGRVEARRSQTARRSLTSRGRANDHHAERGEASRDLPGRRDLQGGKGANQLARTLDAGGLPVPRIDVVSSSPIVRSARVLQLEGLFDVPPSTRSEERWTVDVQIEERPWSVGLIVGPSGAGKSTVARELFGTDI